jgi:DNA-binding IscR family transcriptional regulator
MLYPASLSEMNSRFSLAVHILCLLATMPEERVTSEFLAMSIGTNPVVIRRLMANLREAGLVTAKRAGGGGWMLERPAKLITLDLVRQAVTKDEALRMHKNEPHPACVVGKGVRRVLGGVYERADAAVDRELNGITVAGILSSVLAEKKTKEKKAR